MTAKLTIRQAHRWVSAAFTLGTVVNIVSIARGQQVFWIGMLAFVPLVLLFVSGLYLFALPYLERRRAGFRYTARS